MYTGITRGVFPVVAVEERAGVTRFSVELDDALSRDVQIGASVSIDGVCCTVVAQAGQRLTFDAMQETRSLTTLNELYVGRGVSVERSCRVGDELGGHDVFGHVMGTGTVGLARYVGEQLDLTIHVPASWMRFILHKGFVALDGSSLTVGTVRAEAGSRGACGAGPAAAAATKPEGSFDVHLIPETLRVTNFSKKRSGDRVNVELDARTVAIVETVERVLAQRVSRGAA
jgi:riboflavin synthase